MLFIGDLCHFYPVMRNELPVNYFYDISASVDNGLQRNVSANSCSEDNKLIVCNC